MPQLLGAQAVWDRRMTVVTGWFQAGEWQEGAQIQLLAAHGVS